MKTLFSDGFSRHRLAVQTITYRQVGNFRLRKSSTRVKTRGETLHETASKKDVSSSLRARARARACVTRVRTLPLTGENEQVSFEKLHCTSHSGQKRGRIQARTGPRRRARARAHAYAPTRESARGFDDSR